MKGMMKMFKKMCLTALASLSLASIALNVHDHVTQLDSITAAEEMTQAIVSKDHPIEVDKEGKVVYLAVQMNKKAMEEGSQHAVVDQEGGNGDVALLQSFVNPKDFYQALTDLGAEPGDNLTLDDLKEDKAVEGSPLEITISWEGQEEVGLTDLFTSDNEGIAKSDFRFGGNLETNQELDTGCTICLYSCPVGIVSNAAVSTKDLDGLKVYADPENFPEDGTIMTLKVQVKDSSESK